MPMGNFHAKGKKKLSPELAGKRNCRGYRKEERMKFIPLFKAKACNIAEACEAFGIRRATFSLWMSIHPEFRTAVNEALDAEKDWAESQLKKLMQGKAKYDKDGNFKYWIERPDTAALIFWNKCRNKDRGFTERQELAIDAKEVQGSLNKIADALVQRDTQ